MKVKQDYLCKSWQGLLQQLEKLLNRGYWFHCVTYLPEEKREQWESIDYKLMRKYQADKSKWQRSRQKVKGTANFYYLRWDRIAVILHTKGEIPSHIVYDDNFKNVKAKGKKNRLKIEISNLVGFEFYQNEKRQMTVKLDKSTFTGLRDSLDVVTATKNVAKIKHEFNKLNGFPVYRGIIGQKVQLAKFVVNRAGHHQVGLNISDLRINTFKPYIPVFSEKENKKRAK